MDHFSKSDEIYFIVLYLYGWRYYRCPPLPPPSAPLIHYDWCPCKKRKREQRRTLRGKAMWGHSEGPPRASQGEGSPGERILLLPESWTSSLQNSENTQRCCSSHPLSGILLGQPQQMNTRCDMIRLPFFLQPVLSSQSRPFDLDYLTTYNSASVSISFAQGSWVPWNGPHMGWFSVVFLRSGLFNLA